MPLFAPSVQWKCFQLLFYWTNFLLFRVYAFILPKPAKPYLICQGEHPQLSPFYATALNSQFWVLKIARISQSAACLFAGGLPSNTDQTWTSNVQHSEPTTCHGTTAGKHHSPFYRIHDSTESQSAATAKANQAPISTQPQHKPIIAHYKSQCYSVARL